MITGVVKDDRQAIISFDRVWSCRTRAKLHYADRTLAKDGFLGLESGYGTKIVLIACLTFFPILQTFWIFRETPVLVRTTIAIDEALPLAFVGMILGELWAATAGIGFFIVVTKATSHFAESTAMSLFGFALFVVISFALRCAVKSVTSERKLSAYLSRVTN